MKRFLKRSFVFIITFVLIFSMSVPCFASDTEHGGGGGYYVGMTDDEKLEWWKFRCTYYLARLVGFEEDAANNFAVDTLLPYWDVKGYTTLEEYFVDHVNYNDETDSLDPDDEMVADINICLEQYNDSVTMVYRYPILRNHVLGDAFPTNQIFQNFLDLLEGLPSCYFYFDSTSISSYDQNSLVLPSGEKYFCNNRIRALDLRVLTDCTSGICSSLDLASTSTTFYNDNWTTCVSYYVYLITPFEGTVDTSQYKYFYYSNAGKYVLCESFEDIDFSDCRFSSSVSRASMLSQNYNGTLSTSFLFSAGTQALNCYKSVDDMKKDLGSQVVAGYTPDYTGTCGTSVSVDVVNNIEIPDSGGGSGSGSGSDDNGTGSGGGIFDDIISGIASGVGSIIKGIFSIIKDLVDAIADAIVSITKSITDMSSLLRTNFTDFLSAVFPFLPQEFVKIMIAGLTLCLLGIIIKIFRG